MAVRLTRQQVLHATRAGWYLFDAPSDVVAALPHSRRTFLRVSATATGGLLVLVASRDVLSAAQPAATSAFQPHALIRIDVDDTVTIWASNPDMGEGTKTSLPMLVAEELDADWARVRLENAPLDRRYGGQGVGGSDAISSAWLHHRQAGAVGRHLLVAAAAATWSVSPETIVTARGVARHAASNRQATFGALAARAATMPAPTTPVPLKDASRFTLIGTRVPGRDAAAIVRGQPLFGLDVRKPGMRYAAIAKSPVFGARARHVDAAKALAMPGVQRVVEIAGLPNPTHLMPGVAVVADSTWAALKARDALSIEWEAGRHDAEGTASLRAQAIERLAAPAELLHTSGDVDAALTTARHVVDATYECAFVAHATLEPHNCTAEVRGDECWIEGPLQMPASGRQVVAAALGIPPEKVHVLSSRIGGGFGRRLLSDYAAEAAVVSKAIGAPVQVVDSRAGDLQHDYYRPFAVQRLRAGVDAQGRVIAWDHGVASCSRNAYRKDSRPPSSTEVYGSYVGRVKTVQELDPDLVPTRIPNARLRYAVLDTGVPTGAWRAPSHMAIAFAVETCLDELASRAGRSAVDLRLELLGETGDVPPSTEGYTYDPSRMRQVLTEAAERGGFGRRPSEARARGFAAHFTFGSYCAQVVELSIDDRKRVTVHKVTAVIDCGQPVTLLGIEAQVEGGVVDALGTAFYGEVPIVDGRATVANFDTYRLIRHREAPRLVEVVVRPSRRSPTGTGEIPLPPVAPAVANAIAALTGVRLRQTPFSRDGFTLG